MKVDEAKLTRLHEIVLLGRQGRLAGTRPLSSRSIDKHTLRLTFPLRRFGSAKPRRIGVLRGRASRKGF